MNIKNYFLSTSLLFCLQSLASLPQSTIEAIDYIVNGYPDLSFSCAVYSLNDDAMVYEHNSHQRLTPASNTKIVTALLALEYLGKDFQFVTSMVSDGMLQQGVLKGNLYLKGSGDPSLCSDDVEALIKSLHDQGIVVIEGNVCIDRDGFDHEGFSAGTTIDDLGENWFNPVGALVVDHKALALAPHNEVVFTDSTKMKDMFCDGMPLLIDLFKKYGVALKGVITYGACQDRTVLAEHASAPLAELLQHMMKESDNLYADCLFKKVGAVRYGAPGTNQKSAALLKGFLATKLALNPDEMKIVDGSGLSRYNLISAHQLVELLAWALHQPYAQAFKESLSIAGVDGTLKKRMQKIASKVHAKTGTMGGISALSGYLQTPDDELVFSMLTNNYISASMYTPPCKREIEDAVCLILAGAA